MTKEQLCRKIRTSYCCILVIQQSAELYFSQLQALSDSDPDPIYCDLLTRSFLLYLKREYKKVVSGTDCFLGLIRLSSAVSEYEKAEAAVFHEEAAFPMERDAAFRQFGRLLSDGLRFCEALLQKYEQ